MYELIFLPKAKTDLEEIIIYIRNELSNPQASIRLVEKIYKATERLTEFPYAYPLYYPIKSLKYEYRKLVVENYVILYFVDEKSHSVTIARVVYGKRNVNNIL